MSKSGIQASSPSRRLGSKAKSSLPQSTRVGTSMVHMLSGICTLCAPVSPARGGRKGVAR